MQGSYLFEYAVLRVVPRVEREEFLNIGVVLYCRERAFLGVKYNLDPERLKALSRKLDLSELEKYCEAFAGICAGNKKGNVLETLPPASRFRWLTAKRSSMLQTSPVHPGLCEDPAATLERLMRELVEEPE